MRLRTAACGAPNCAIRSVGASGGRGVDDDRDTFWFRDRRLFAAFLGLHHARPSRTGTCMRAPEEKHALMGSAAYTHSVPLAPTSSRARLLPRPSCSDESDLFGCTACQQTQNEDTAEHEGNRAQLAPRTPAGLPLQVSSLPSAIAHSPVRVREGETVTRGGANSPRPRAGVTLPAHLLIPSLWIVLRHREWA